MKVLLVGHGCSPRQGGEPGFTWNWAWHLSATNEVRVLAHPHDRGAVERFLEEHPNPRLRFQWVTLAGGLDPWNPAKGERGLLIHYVMWQQAALREATRLHKSEGFDVIHHVSWGTVKWVPQLWRLPVPFVWGPLGGGQVAPEAFRRYFGSSWAKEILRALYLKAISRSRPLREAAKRAALVLATNQETARILEAAGAEDVEMFLDSGLSDHFVLPAFPERLGGHETNLLWVGRLEQRKCLPLALEALARLGDLPIRLRVIGKGPMRKPWEELARELGVAERVSFLGWVSHADMPALYASSDIFLFTSLRDSFGSQVLEAMGSGLPVVMLDHQGVGAFVPPEAGEKVPVSTPGETVTGLANAIRRLAESAEARVRNGRAAWQYAGTQTWRRRAERMNALYALAASRPSSVARKPRGPGEWLGPRNDPTVRENCHRT